MSYAQCPPFWPYLKNKVIDEETLPLLTYDWSGPTYRNESGGIHGLDRLEEFHRIETLFVGTKEQVIETWQKLKDAFRKFYDETLDLELNIIKVTPWWMAHAGVRTEQGNEEVGTYDFETYLPYRGDRSKEWLEVGNDSSNGDKYPTAWNVKSRTQDILWSGCAGTSFERIIVSFLAQKGLDVKNWPKRVRGKYEEKIKNMKTLKFY
jgi:seryl-tRNA synthetase